ncbi:MAG: hypothetical protein WB441_10780 [Nocardioidaceae bacterium]
MGGHPIAGMVLFALGVGALLLGTRGRRWVWVHSVSVVVRLRPRRRPVPQPRGRPIQEIARDAQRLGQHFQDAPPTLSHARYEGLRLAYDRVLVEACDTLQIDHLLGLIPPSPERDVERRRVEAVLQRTGLPIHYVG